MLRRAEETNDQNNGYSVLQWKRKKKNMWSNMVEMKTPLKNSPQNFFPLWIELGHKDNLRHMQKVKMPFSNGKEGTMSKFIA